MNKYFPIIVGLLLILACGVVPQAQPPSMEEPPAPPSPAPSRSGPGQTYYVAPNGSDSNPGTREQPWATPGYGSRQLTPGDTLVILGGRYVLSRFDDYIITPPSGTAYAWITIRGD
ncbi:MAG: right-handed parallel beta-helix repeat-containing protein, partial [Anaerolineae bacterium]